MRPIGDVLPESLQSGPVAKIDELVGLHRCIIAETDQPPCVVGSGMKNSPIRRLFVIVVLMALLVLTAVGCTAPSGGATAGPTEPAVSIAPSASPAASGGGKYGDEYATPDP